jgi:hypothetical protein
MQPVLKGGRQVPMFVPVSDLRGHSTQTYGERSGDEWSLLREALAGPEAPAAEPDTVAVAQLVAEAQPVAGGPALEEELAALRDLWTPDEPAAAAGPEVGEAADLDTPGEEVDVVAEEPHVADFPVDETLSLDVARLADEVAALTGALVEEREARRVLEEALAQQHDYAEVLAAAVQEVDRLTETLADERSRRAELESIVTALSERVAELDVQLAQTAEAEVAYEVEVEAAYEDEVEAEVDDEVEVEVDDVVEDEPTIYAGPERRVSDDRRSTRERRRGLPPRDGRRRAPLRAARLEEVAALVPADEPDESHGEAWVRRLDEVATAATAWSSNDLDRLRPE